MNFSFKAIKKLNRKKDVQIIFKKHTTGIVIEECDEHSSYFVVSEDIKYPITLKSYETKGKKVVYFKDIATPKSVSVWGCIIRTMKEDRFAMPKQYIPFRPGYEVVGNIIVEHSKHIFDIKGCYKPNSSQKVEVLKELENEEECQN